MRIITKYFFIASLIFLCCYKNCEAVQLSRNAAIPDNMGVNIHFLDKDMNEHIALLKEAGFGWVRKDLSWERIESKKGVYDFAKYDALIDALNNAGIKVLLILDYHTPNYDNNNSPYTLEGRAAFARFTEAAAQRYANKDVAWEIYNEPNTNFWKPAPHLENYMALAKEVTKTLRRIVPHQPILGPALAGPTDEKKKLEYSYTYLNAVLEHDTAKQWDAITVHPYRNSKPPENIHIDMPRLRKIMSDNSIKAPLIFGEWGYHTADKGISEDLEAAYALRVYLLANSMRMPFAIWYNWQERGDDSSEPEDKYGIIRNGPVDKDDDDLRKPAFKAISEFSAKLSGYRFDKTISDTNEVFCMRFKKGDRIAYVAWTSSKETKPYQLSLPGGYWQAKPILGDSNYLGTSTGPVSLQLTSMPTLIMTAPQ